MGSINKAKFKEIIVLQARTNSKRLPGKSLLMIGGFPLVVLSAYRLVNSEIPLIIVIPDSETDDYLEKVLVSYDLACFRGNEYNVLERFTEALKNYDEDTIVIRATADNVFPDKEFVKLVLKEFKERKLKYLAANGHKCGLPYGLSLEVCYLEDLREANQYNPKMTGTTKDHVKRAFKNCIMSEIKEHVTPYIIAKYGKIWSTQFLPMNYSGLNCTIDTLEDYLRIAPLFKQGMQFTLFQELCKRLAENEKDNI